ncbi:DNA repair protein rad2 [Exophiala xenobiotica]|uniref:DNA repair protein rad2 n=1 Tax=Vermiconidia calcicola TaxID=1690605 RepID=A0AAV9QB16_9PEZI|nr:DNA repair protein rad2 [Exophiala xenobiotica]KAK5429919.1 DNA repair protein rad2 [Exophiala xenobiotica]KAK5536851.1 DNA repair protein rad2 [Vermiconidia calcicola]KAK5542999.1 DNA repair protein rad2 [Chaetothyriales sp. CCFEE 6169]
MGVTGLWTVVAPTARPTQLASLNRKRLAVDASIWIYQFLKAVRDKEGNALRNSHVVGFFRRICKLLYFGIKPVFVFDGGAPILKRETVRKRARRREGRREDAARTAGKLLAVQVARAAEEEEKRRRARPRTPEGEQDEIADDQELVYVDELGMSARERQAGRGEKFKKKDQYHLPDLDVSIADMGAPNDPRIMSQAELEEYARQFHSGEDVNLYDFSKIDFESPFFLSLPAGDRYNILNAARLRSRLRMGYSKEQLDGMFPDRMAFSKFQIERVKERNELTQRLMGINGMSEGDWLMQGGGRVAGEKGKEYILVKNDGVEGGWALGVVSDKKGSQRENAIDLEEREDAEDETMDEEDNEDFEDVAIEGLNRIPNLWTKKRKAREYDRDMGYDDAVEAIAKKRKAVYEARRVAGTNRPEVTQVVPNAEAKEADDDALFVPEDNADDEDIDDLFEDVLPVEITRPEEDDDLQRAIAMSLEEPFDVQDAGGIVPEQAVHEKPGPADEDEGFDLHAALAESRMSKHKAKTNVRQRSPSPKPDLATPKFDGPLPFESINLGQSLLGKKKSKKIQEDLSGGFDRDLGEDAFRKERPPQPMPAWFNAAPSTNDLKHAPEPEHDSGHDEYARDSARERETIRRHDTKEVIDLEAEDEPGKEVRPIEIEEGNEEDADVPDIPEPSQDITTEPEIPEVEMPTINEEEEAERQERDAKREQRYEMARQIAAENDTDKILMDDVAEKAQAEPPQPSNVPDFNPASATSPLKPDTVEAAGSDYEEVEWSESDHEQPTTPGSLGTVDDDKSEDRAPKTATPTPPAEEDDDEGEDFEDVQMSTPPPTAAPAGQEYLAIEKPMAVDALEDPFLLDEPHNDTQSQPQTAIAEEEFEYLSESEEELMRQLAVEAEEHARFASSLHNQRTSEQAIRDYESELKQLRNQQKKDRRDADEVTQVMVQECQALLRLFGLPYITAPMEAEAQCAELVHLGLVDGIVTDDSDIFLFGGTRIYKNMFNAAKYVECYLASELEKEFLLDRRRLIRFAHLLGSDYTEGIPGVGPVTALEILTDFDTLTEFKEWCSRVQLGRPQDLENQLTTPFRRKFRNTVQKRLFLPPGFPDSRVDEAYLNPEVDSNPEPFQWGVPDLDKLRSYLMATIGWSQERTDEVLVPVIRDMNKREVEGTQSNITRFFSGSVGVGGRANAPAAGSGLAMGGEGPGNAGIEGMAPRNRTGKESGRMKNAFKRLRGEAVKRRKGDELEQGGEESVVEVEEPELVQDGGVESEAPVGTSKRKVPSRSRRAQKANEQKNGEAENGDVEPDDDDNSDFAEDEAPSKKAKSRAKGKATKTRTKKR